MSLLRGAGKPNIYKKQNDKKTKKKALSSAAAPTFCWWRCDVYRPSLLSASGRHELCFLTVWLGCGEGKQKRSGCRCCILSKCLVCSLRSPSQRGDSRCRLYVRTNLLSFCLWKSPSHGCQSSYLLIHSAVVYSHGDKSASGTALIHSHLWIELKLSRPHSAVTGGMCR